MIAFFATLDVTAVVLVAVGFLCMSQIGRTRFNGLTKALVAASFMTAGATVAFVFVFILGGIK